MKLRPLVIADLDATISLEQSVSNNISWEPSTHDEQRPIFQKGHAFGIFENNTLIGKVGFIEKDPYRWQVDGLIIDPAYRSKGLGQKLFTYALKCIVEKEKPSQLFLFVYPGNSAAIRTYLRTGFVIKEWINDKYGPGKHRIKMEMSP